jgi:spermidine synthase
LFFPGIAAKVIERCRGREGELQLQRRGEEFEIIYNGVFLMATYNGASEKEAVREALKLVNDRGQDQLKVLIGGLGVGYSLQEALAFKQVVRVVVSEIEPAIIRWNREFFREINDHALDDPRTVLLNYDFRKVLEQEAEKSLLHPARKYDVIMVDTDNGSSWLSLPGNAYFYSTDSLKLIASCLQQGGAACFWCSGREETFEAELKEIFRQVSFQCVPEKTGQEGCYYLALKDTGSP